MTQEEILAMGVGRELDIFIANEVFGIEVEWDYPPWDINHISPKLPFRKGKPRTVLGPMAHSISNAIDEYSTDISAAWQVVERIVGAGFCIAPKVIITNDEVGWYCSILPNAPREEGKVVALGDTAPEAICKAARRYVEEVGND